MRLLIICVALSLLFVSPIFGQVCQDSESDTLYVIEARSALRYRLNDYDTNNKHWPDSVLNSFLSQVSWSIPIEKRDTIVTTSSVYCSLATDFNDIRGVMIKNDSRWGKLIKPDSSGAGAIVKQDTITTVADQAEYSLNSDFLNNLGIVKKTASSTRWVGLLPKPVIGPDKQALLGGSGESGTVFSYSILGKRLLLDPPPTDAGDLLIVYYTAFEYTVSDKRLVLTSPNSGDSLIVFYLARPNNLTSDSVIVNIPFKFREQLIEGAYALAMRAISK